MEKDLEYYLNLNWTIIEGTDLDFNQNPYYYIEIKELPGFCFCARTKEAAYENYKTQLKLFLQIAVEYGDKIIEPGNNNNDTNDDIWESLCQ